MSLKANSKEAAKKILRSIGLYEWVYLIVKGLKCRITNAWFRVRGLSDGLPIPPAKLIFAVAGTSDIKWFFQRGAMAADSIREVLTKNGINPASLHAVLDLGCGCGRVIRHMKSQPDCVFYGTDYNPALVDWCRANLDFARFNLNSFEPPLSYQNAQFDFVYALSVFTHLPEDEQFRWLSELKRIIKEGGYLLLTTHGAYYLRFLTAAERLQFEMGELVVRNSEHAGQNLCSTYHPREYVMQNFSDGFEVVDFVARGARGNPMQDVFLLKRVANRSLNENRTVAQST